MTQPRPSIGRRLALLVGLPTLLLVGAPIVTAETGSAARLRVTAAPIQSEDHAVEIPAPSAPETAPTPGPAPEG